MKTPFWLGLELSVVGEERSIEHIKIKHLRQSNTGYMLEQERDEGNPTQEETKDMSTPSRGCIKTSLTMSLKEALCEEH